MIENRPVQSFWIQLSYSWHMEYLVVIALENRIWRDTLFCSRSPPGVAAAALELSPVFADKRMCNLCERNFASYWEGTVLSVCKFEMYVIPEQSVSWFCCSMFFRIHLLLTFHYCCCLNCTFRVRRCDLSACVLTHVTYSIRGMSDLFFGDCFAAVFRGPDRYGLLALHVLNISLTIQSRSQYLFWIQLSCNCFTCNISWL